MNKNNFTADNSFFEESLKGTRLMIYFRWLFIGLISMLIAMQAFAGHFYESMHSIILISIYAVANIVFLITLKSKYDPIWLRYVSAIVDVGIIIFHLHFLTINFDAYAVTSAASILLIPVMILLYTFKLDKKLLYFIVVLTVLAYTSTYLNAYFRDVEFYKQSNSLSLMSHFFKTTYIAFIGLLCIYLQYSYKQIIDKRIDETKKQTELNNLIELEKQKFDLANNLVAKERSLNKALEKEVEENRRLTEDLSRNREKLESIITNLPGAVYRCLPDEEWTMLFISDQIEKISGYNSAEILEKKYSYNELIHEEDREYCRQIIMSKLKEKEPFRLDYRLVSNTGEIVWVHESGSGTYNHDGNLEHIEGIINDITESKYIQTALVSSEKKYRELMDFLPQTIYELDLNGNISFCNKVGRELFGITEDLEETQVYAFKFFIPEDKERVIQNSKKRFSGEIVQEYYEYTAINGNGVEFPVLIYSSPLKKNDQIIGSRGIILDVSKLKETEKSLSTAKRELEKLNFSLEKEVDERTQQLTEANTRLIELQKENLQSQFEVLKQQVNPHFLFNSLNVLTSLIKVDPDLAESFTENLSKVYRYVLENKDKDLVSLSTELDFIKAYIFLINIRFMDKVFVDINISAKYHDLLVLPMALQLIIENSIKHNSFSKQKPLNIFIYVENENTLVTENNLQIRETYIQSTGVGLSNIKNRYTLITGKEPQFEKTQEKFIVKIPLI